MCGIAGFIGLGDRDDLAAMTHALSHRGPDGHSEFLDEKFRVHLGHRRLAVIDVATGQQPMWNEDETVCVIFNGEIYNHAELRADLEQRGHRFASDHSDTEVLVHGWEEWREELPLRLNGMFAFAIFDRRQSRLFLARDRMGEKPLYYTLRNGLFAFASELTALAKHRAVSSEIDPRSVQKLLAYGYLPAPNALYRHCAKLPAGHFLTYDIATGNSRTSCYWEFRIEADEVLTEADEPRLIEELRALLGDSVRRRLDSDVPLGLFLSGGLDSSTCLLMASAYRDAREIETFTIGFREPSFDEAPFAREVATFFGTRHHEKYLELADAKNVIAPVLSALDEPFGDPSILPTYLLNKMAREHVTVALTGDGGDELFAGYDPFKALAPASLYDRLVPKAAHRGLRHIVDWLPRSNANMSFDFKLRRTLMGLSYPSKIWNPVWMSPLEPDHMAEMIRNPLPVDDLYSEAIAVWEGSHTNSIVDRTLEFFTRLYLQDDILTKSDRASMMVSLETRAIFLDNDIVDFCSRLPHRFKLKNGRGKHLLRAAVAADLPRNVTQRPKKGFGIPLAQWLRDLDILVSSNIPGADSQQVERLWREHRAGEKDHRLFLWTWLALQGSPGAARPSTEVSQSWN